MPLVPKSQVAPHQLYGVGKIDMTLNFRERVRKLFRPGDQVKVRNITNQLLEWQWMDEQEETFTIEDDTNIKITERGDPGLWRLGPGEIDYLPGSCAYVMLDVQYKMICVMKLGVVLHPLDEREVRNFSFDDPEKQQLFLEAAFIETVNQSRMHQLAVEGDNIKPKVLEQLMPLSTEHSEYDRRHREETARFGRPKAEDGPHQELGDLAKEFDDGAALLGRATGGLPDSTRSAHQDPAESDESVSAVKSKQKQTVKA